ncbi:MAG TPA: GNAT family N-acetyltransferase [Saprospiraceae bacterium]|nr:GNAT family N-acetyltransferase [Saprospiraceae bacterium]
MSLYCAMIDFGTPEFDEALKLRYDVLRKPLNLEFDENDIATEFDSFHIACYDQSSNELLGILILKPVDAHTLKMRQVAVSAAAQSKGVGTFMVQASEQFATHKNYKKIELHARLAAVDFYLKNGYTAEGDIFKEVGIDHQSMFKIL